MIHKVEDGFVISSHQVWIPGVYDTKRTANYAFRFDDSDLQKLQDVKNKTNDVITFKDLQNLKKLTKIKEKND